MTSPKAPDAPAATPTPPAADSATGNAPAPRDGDSPTVSAPAPQPAGPAPHSAPAPRTAHSATDSPPAAPADAPTETPAPPPTRAATTGEPPAPQPGAPAQTRPPSRARGKATRKTPPQAQAPTATPAPADVPRAGDTCATRTTPPQAPDTTATPAPAPQAQAPTATPAPAPPAGGNGGVERFDALDLAEAEVCRDAGAFGALAGEWGRLHKKCGTASAFQSHAWLHSWWLSYGKRGRLRVVLVRRGGELVGAAALMLTYRPVPRLVAVGGAITDYADVLVDESDPDNAPAMADALRRAARGALIDLREVRPGGAAERVFALWHGSRRKLADSVCLELPGLPMDELIARVGSSRGQRIRANLRKLDAAGVEEHDVAPAEVPAAVRNMLRLHLAQWQGRGVTPEHVRPRFAEHLTRATTRMVAAGDAVVTEFRLDGAIVAANLTVLSPGLAGGYLYGSHPDLRGTKVDVTTLLMRHGVRQASGGGRATLSLLRGAEPHKFHWRPDHVANQRLLLAGPPLGLVLHLYAALAAGRTRLRAAAARRLPALRTWRARLNDRRARKA